MSLIDRYSSQKASRQLDYGIYSLSQDKTISGLTYGVPVNAVVKQGGDLTLDANGVNLKSGRTYKIKVFGQMFYDSTTLRTEFALYDATNSVEISQEALSAVTEADLADNRTTLPYAETIYTAPNDCSIGIYATRASRPVTCLAGFVTMIVEELIAVTYE